MDIKEKAKMLRDALASQSQAAQSTIKTWQERTASRLLPMADALQLEVHRAKDAEIAELRANLAAATPAELEGWELVPFKYTPEMRAAWDRAPQSEDDDRDFAGAYAALIDAAPEAPAGVQSAAYLAGQSQATKAQAEPVAWMNPNEGSVMDAFLWLKDPANPQYSQPVYAAPVAKEAYPTFQHPDDSAVDRFAAAMKAKMAASRAKGRGGWDNEALCPAERLQSMLIEHLSKGDPVDVSNFAMMLWNRGEPVASVAKEAPAVPDHKIYAVIDGMGWDLDDTERCDMYHLCRAALDLTAAPQAPVAMAEPELTVWYGSMPESNGKSNFTAILTRKDAKGLDVFDGFTIARSEYPDRVRYEADCVRHLIGELPEKPFILDYDADKHSGYVAPVAATKEAESVQAEGVQAHVLPPTRGTGSRHPIQPLGPDEHGRIRFKRNAIVDFLSTNCLNELSAMDFPQEDWEQLAQLIGYSLDGFGMLSYVTDETYEAAAATLEQMQPAGSAREGGNTNAENFTDWLKREMPPGTVISDPAWWAPRILRAVGSDRAPTTSTVSAPAVQFLANVVADAAPMLRSADRAKTADLLEMAVRDLQNAAPSSTEGTQAAPQEVRNQWISVAERLPELHQTVALLDEKRWMNTGSSDHNVNWHGSGYLCEFGNKFWSIFGESRSQCLEAVTHWMPLSVAPSTDTGSAA